MSLQAYQRARTVAELPRAVEKRLMTEITGEMIAARDAGHVRGALMPVLHRNREAWGTLAAVCGVSSNKLPDTLRAGITSLAIWVDRCTSSVIAGRDTIDELIGVNLTLIEGLS